MKKYEYYQIVCTRSTPGILYTYERVGFKVRAVSHIQHIPYSTMLNGLADSATAKIRKYKADGWRVTTTVGGRVVAVEN